MIEEDERVDAAGAGKVDSDPVQVDAGRQVQSSAGIGRLALILTGLAFVATILMVVALFLPWATNRGATQGLSDYAAPQPAVVAWALLALGLSTVIVTLVSMLLGGRRSAAALAAGALVYGVGAVVWYASSILPSVVASGCVSNGGPLCNPQPGSSTLPGEAIGAGLVLGLAGAVGLLVVFAIWHRFTALEGEPPASE